VQLIAQSAGAVPRPAQDKQSGADVLLLPGLDGSPPRHWQSHWERLGHCRRVALGDWSRPRLHDWVPALDRAVRESARPVVLAAHSLGCLAAAWWASLCWVEAFRDKVRGALFVAPPDVNALTADPRLRDFRPSPRLRLPFRTILVASRDDPYAPYARSEAMAACWGSTLVDVGESGHLNADSGLYEWTQGLRLLAGLSGHNPNLLVAEMGLRAAMA
jgi:predicted alpha/beta hydrolase family esterase